MTNTKTFPTLDLVTVTTGILVADRPNTGHPIDAVYEVCGWMLNDALMTHQLPNASRVCSPYIVEQHPWIGELNLPKGDLPALKGACARIVEEHGDTLTLTMPEDPAWATSAAMNDLEAIRNGRPVVGIRVEGES